MKTVHFFDIQTRRTRALDADIHWVDTDYTLLHNHFDFWEYWVVTDGKCLHTVNGRECRMERGDGILLRPGKDMHCIKKDGEFSHINFAIRDGLMRQYLAFLSPTLGDEWLAREDELLFHLDARAYEKIIRYASAFLQEAENGENTAKTARIFCSFIVEDLLSRLFDAAQDCPQWICDLIVTINKPENLGASPGEIAATCHYSRQHVLRIFKRYTGKSLGTYLCGIKMEAAREMLVQKRYTVLEIAEKLGFDSVSYFDRLYKKTFGHPPTAEK